MGYAISNPELIRYLNDAKYSFNSYTMNQTALICGAEAVKDRAYFEENLQKIIQTREWAKKELAGMGFELTDSRANFLFVRHPKYSGKDLFEFLKKQKNICKVLGKQADRGLSPHYSRNQRRNGNLVYSTEKNIWKSASPLVFISPGDMLK